MGLAVRVGLIFGIVVMAAAPAQAQFRMRASDFRDPIRVTPEIDRSIQQALTDAKQAIKAGQYVPAAIQLQSVLDHPEDYFLQRDFGTKTAQFRTVKEQANRILAELPDKALATYELNYGAAARTMLNEALQRSDRQQIAELVRRYEMTAAGFEGLQILAEAAQDRGQPLEAALLYESMMNHPLAAKQSAGPMMLRTAFAWYRAGNPDRSIAALNSLKDFDAFANWRIGAKKVPPFREGDDGTAWMAVNFGPPATSSARTINEWILSRGGPSNNESASVAFPIGGEAWSISPLENIRLKFDESNSRWQKELFDRTDQIIKMYRDRNQLIQPVAVPIVVGDVVCFRTPNDITAVNLRSGQLKWRSSITDGVLALLSQTRPIANVPVVPQLALSVAEYLWIKQFQDRLAGTLTSDGKLLYAIEESGSGALYNLPRSNPRQRTSDSNSMVPTNKLVAYDLTSGRLAWEAGGTRGTEPVELSGSFFLGPPVLFEGHLYCLAEMKDELCLLCLTADQKTVRLEWSQSLVAINRSVSVSALRRQSGLTPALADGLAICPTSSGSVVAFDLVRRQLRWGYGYEPQRYYFPPDGFGTALPGHSDDDELRWTDGSALLANSRIIITPLDSADLHCVNLIDGSLIWKRPRKSGAYVACVNDNAVIVVGRTHVIAVSLVDGSDLWSQPIEIPPPSGRGVRIDSRYLLPLSSGEIATIDLSKGQIVARSSLADEQIPGNLAIREGTLVSCGTRHVLAFRPLADLEKQIASLTSKPDDPEALALRGELELHEGETDSAVADLRASLGKRADPKVKRTLAATLLNTNLGSSKRLLSVANELDSLITDSSQRIEFLRAYVRALIEAGQRPEAVRQLFRLAETPMKPDELITLESGYSVALWQHLRTLLLTTFENGNADEQKAIVQIFEKEFETATAHTDRDEKLSRYIDLVFDHPAASSSLKQFLAGNTLFASDADRIDYLERLGHSRDKSIAGIATARLVQSYMDTKSATNAYAFIVGLGSDFASIICQGEKTGKQLHDEWMSNEDVQRARKPAATWPERPVEATRNREPLERVSVPLPVVTHVGNHFRGWSFEIDTITGVFTARDPSLQVAWRLNRAGLMDVSRTPATQLHIRGRNVVIQSGMYLMSLKCTESSKDPKILFERVIRTNSPTDRRQFDIRPRRPMLANGRRFPSDFDGFLIGLSNEAVIYQMENRLFAADIETGQILWIRNAAVLSKSEGTVDDLIVLYTANHDAVLLRPLDGAVQQQHKCNLDETPICFQGTRRLSYRNDGPERRIFELRDFNGDKIVWQSQHPEGTLTSHIGYDEVAFLEPSGRLMVVDFATGESILKAETTIVRPHGSEGAFTFQKYGNHYVIFAGGPIEKRPPPPIVIPKTGLSNEEAFVIDGVAAAIDRGNGRIIWSVPVKQMACDSTQPHYLPVLVLGSRQSDIERPGTQRVAVLLLDKRTGRAVFEEQPIPSRTRDTFSGGGRGVQFDPRVDDEKLILVFDHQDWNLVLTFPNDPKPSN